MYHPQIWQIRQIKEEISRQDAKSAKKNFILAFFTPLREDYS
jgi:hypothetical protein